MRGKRLVPDRLSVALNSKRRTIWSKDSRTKKRRGHLPVRIALGVSLILGMIVLPVTLFNDAGATANAVPGTAPIAPHRTASAEAIRGTAVDGLFPFTTVTGKVYMSLTGIGTNTPTGGPIYVQKDSSKSTVKAAYLLAAGIPGFFGSSAYAIGDGTITLDGNSLSFTPADVLTQKFSTSTEFAVDNVWTNVTTIVAPVVDAAPTGLVKFTAAEPTETDEITGEILAVIMNDPTLPTDNTVSFLFGGLDPTGDSFNIGLANPLKLSTPTLALIMSIGDSFGYQGPPGDGQYSTITVDTKLMTSSAGGNDDSICKYNTPPDFASCGNGELITVGGIGDTPTDPAHPTATTSNCTTPPGPPRCTDELYSLLPFVTTGQTSITVKTQNPSHNDDIFFTGFELNAAVGVVGEGAVLTPVTGTNPVGSPYTFTAKVQDKTGAAVADQAITLTVLSGPDAGKVIPSTTNTTGIATFTYTGTSAGTDVVRASFTSTEDTVYSNTAQVTWTTTVITPPPRVTRPPPPPPAPIVTAVYGTTSDGTAAAEFDRAFPYTKDSCPTTRAAVVATTTTYQDALSSQFLAQSLTTGTLLTPTESLSPVTAATLMDEGINTVYIVGGPLAITTTVARDIADMTAYECGGTTPTPTTGKIVIHRVWGKTQYGTAKAVAEFVGTGASLSFTGAFATTNAAGGSGRYNDTSGNGSAAPKGSEPTAIVASGEEFQDAQVASVISYHTRLPLLLTAATTLSTTAIGAIKALGIKQVILMGGPLAVSNTVEAALVAKTGVSVLRVAGNDYTDTAAELTRFEVGRSTTGLGWTPGHRMMVSRGNWFTDGIAGAVLDSRHNTATGTGVRPLLLTESPTVVGTYLTTFLKVTGHTGIDKTTTKTITNFAVLGGPLAVSTTSITAMETDLSH